MKRNRKRAATRYVQRVNKTKNSYKRNPTPSEKRFGEFLQRRGIQHKFQVTTFTEQGKGYIIDFEIKCKKQIGKVWCRGVMAIEIDGDTHITEEQQKKDRVREIDLYLCGYDKVVHIRNEETTNDLDILQTLVPQIPDTYAFRDLKDNLNKEWMDKRLSCF